MDAIRVLSPDWIFLTIPTRAMKDSHLLGCHAVVSKERMLSLSGWNIEIFGLLDPHDGTPRSAESSANVYQSTWRNIPADLNLPQHRVWTFPNLALGMIVFLHKIPLVVYWMSVLRPRKEVSWMVGITTFKAFPISAYCFTSHKPLPSPPPQLISVIPYRQQEGNWGNSRGQ